MLRSMDRTAQRRWPYIALAGGLAAMLILAAAVSFDWLPSNDQDGVLADPCSAVPKKVITNLIGDATPVPNPQNADDRICTWSSPVEDDPDRIREIRITLHGTLDVDRTFTRMKQTLVDDGYTKAKAPRKNNDRALAWTLQERKMATASILLARGGTTASIRVAGSRYPNGKNFAEADNARDELLGMVRSVAGEIALPAKASVVERQDNKRSRIKTVHNSPESTDSCAVSDKTLHQVLGNGYQKSDSDDERVCGWSQETIPNSASSDLSAKLNTYVNQSDPVTASTKHLESPGELGIEFSSVELFDTLGEEYGEPGDATVLVAHTTARLPDGGYVSLARVTLRVDDTAVVVYYTGYNVTKDGKMQEADPAVMKKNALAVAKDLVNDLT